MACSRAGVDLASSVSFFLSGGLDYLVLNHVGGNVGFHLFKGNMEIVKSSITINFLSYVQLTSSALHMLQESEGSIIVVSSISGRGGNVFDAIHSLIKPTVWHCQQVRTSFTGQLQPS